MFRNRLALLALLTVVCSVPTTVLAGNPAYIFGAQDDHFFRLNTGTGTLDQFTLSDAITALDFDANGNLWAMQRSDNDLNGFLKMYRVADPYGSPNLVEVNEGVNRNTPAITFDGNTMYAIQGIFADGINQSLVTLNTATGAATNVGDGNTGRPGGISGVTIAGGAMYALDNTNPGFVCTVDWTLVTPPSPDADCSTGTNYWPITSSLDHDANDTLWALIRPQNGMGGFNLFITTLNPATGEHTIQYDLTTSFGPGKASSIAVPEPASLALLAVGGLVLARRRRR